MISDSFDPPIRDPPIVTACVSTVEDPLDSVVVDHNDFVAVAATATAVISKNSFPFAN